ncbi:MAG: universal stress protein [Acidimicrobiales bacterium]
MSQDSPSTGAAVGGPGRIVVGFDGSRHAAAAVDWAAVQAQCTGAALDIVSAVGSGHALDLSDGASQDLGRLADEAVTRARRFAPGVVVTATSIRGSPDDALIAESVGAGLLVVGSRGLGGFRGLLLGSVGRKCVHGARCPVIVVRSDEPVTGPDGTGTTSVWSPEEVQMTSTQTAERHRIVVGIDGSPSSMVAVEWAARQAELTGATLEVLMTWEWPANYGWSLSLPPDYDPQHDSEAVLEEAMGPVRTAHPGITVETTVIEGHPAPILVKASSGADLLVVGSRGHGEFAGMLLGSVSEHCVANAHCPVVVVRDHD